MSIFQIKLLAAFALLIEHAGLAFFPSKVLFHCVGSMAFPLYCFLAAEGFRHTRHLPRYFLRVLLLAIVTEPCYDQLMFSRLVFPLEQNAVFALALGFLLLAWNSRSGLSALERYAGMCLLLLASMLLHLRFGFLAPSLMLAFYQFAGKRSRQLLAFFLLYVLYTLLLLLSGVHASFALSSLCGLLAMLPIACYNGKSGPSWRPLRLAFYLFYPFLLLLLLCLRMCHLVPPYLLG